MTTDTAPPRLDGYLFDLDGTLYLSDQAIPGAPEAVARVRERGARAMFITNKPLYAPQEYCDKLTRLGIPAHRDEVLTSSLALAAYVGERHRGGQVLAVAEEVVRRDLQQAGARLTDDPGQAEAVVLSWDRGFHYEALNCAMQAILRGARFYATNPDVACPMGGGRLVPDCGALIAAVTACTGRQPDFIAGKPSPGLPREALRRMGLPPRRCALVGDRLSTDMACARNAGMTGILVLTGVTRAEDVARAEPAHQPHHVIESVAELA